MNDRPLWMAEGNCVGRTQTMFPIDAAGQAAAGNALRPDWARP